MTGAIINLIILVPFLILAVFLSQGKGAFLIAGYNTLTDEQRAEYDELALCQFMGKIMYGICGCLVLMAVSELLDNEPLLYTGIGLITFLAVSAAVFVNTGNHFKKKKQ